MPQGFLPSSFWQLHGPEGGLAGVYARAKQIVAGAAESTIANTATQAEINAKRAQGIPTAYRPAIIDQPGAMYGVISSLVKGKAPDPGSFSANALMRSRLASVRTNQTLGIHDPQNTAETALRTLGYFVVPGPKGANIVAKAAEDAPFIAKAARTLARGATEMAVPLNQTGIKGAALGTAIGTGITEGVNKVAPIPGYEGVGDAKSQEELNFDRAIQQTPAQEETSLNQEGPSPAESAFDLSLNNQARDQQEIEANQHRFMVGAAVVASALGGYQALKYVRGYLPRTLEDAATRITGKQFITSRGSPLSKFTTTVANAQQPLIDIAEETLGPKRAAQFGYKFDQLVNVSMGSKMHDQFVTGRLVGTGGRTVKLAPLAEAWAKDLNPQQQLQVSDALLAASALDDFKNTGTLSSLNKNRAGNVLSPVDLDKMVRDVKSDPKLSKYFDQVQQSYRDKLKYELQRGLIDQKTYDEFINKRPNYVEMNRNLEPDVSPTEGQHDVFNANKTLGASRSLDELGGVQGPSGVANPFHSLFGSWTDTVQRAEINDTRSTFLKDIAPNSPLNADGKPIVKQLPRGQKPYKTENVHQVFENGEIVNYRVLDPAINKALHFAPRATATVLGPIRRFSQGMITGPIASVFNGFNMLVSPLYDAQAGTWLRPRGVALPSFIHSATGLNIPDPSTITLQPYIGAMRYMGDAIREKVAVNVASQMFRDSSMLRSLLGDNGLKSLSDMLEASHEASIKAEMDRAGIASHTMYGSADPSKIAVGAESAAPNFNISALDQANKDIQEAAANGDITKFKAFLKTTGNDFAKLKSGKIASIYQMISEAAHNGFRYQAFTANRNRIKEMDQLTSNMRRLSIDAAQHGGGLKTNKFLDSIPYANLSTQGLYELGKMIKNDPMRFATNSMTLMGLVAMMKYGALLYDPEALAKHRSKTPEQKANSITTFGSIEMMLDPMTRILTSLAFPVLDHISGIDGPDPNPDFFGNIAKWWEGDEGLDEATKMDRNTALKETALSVNPVDIRGFPGVSQALGAYGVDVGTAKMTGEPSLVRPQEISGLDQGASSPDGVGSSYMGNLMASIFYSTGRAMYAMTDDMYRTYGYTGSVTEAMKSAGSRYQDNLIKTSGMARPLFGNYETVKSIADTNYKLVKQRQTGIDNAVMVYQKNVVLPEVTGTNARNVQMMPENLGVLNPQVAGTQLGYIAAAGNQLNKDLKVFNDRLSDLSEENEYIKNSVVEKGAANKYIALPMEKKNKMQNSLVVERKQLNFLKLQAIHDTEQAISKQIGKPFRFDDFDPKDYMQPIQPAQ